MGSRQYVVQGAAGCSAKGQTIAKLNWRWSFYSVIRALFQAIEGLHI
jgi:hypothetical protein